MMASDLDSAARCGACRCRWHAGSRAGRYGGSACPADAGVSWSVVWLVGVAGGLVDAAAGCSPGHLAGSWLVEVPAVGLLTPMVMSAERREVAFAGAAPGGLVIAPSRQLSRTGMSRVIVRAFGAASALRLILSSSISSGQTLARVPPYALPDADVRRP